MCRGRTVTHHDYVLYGFDVLIALCVLFWVRELMLSTFTLPLVCCLFIPVSWTSKKGTMCERRECVHPLRHMYCSYADLRLPRYGCPLLNTWFLALVLLISAYAFPHISQMDRTGAASSTSPGSLLPREQAKLTTAFTPWTQVLSCLQFICTYGVLYFQ